MEAIQQQETRQTSPQSWRQEATALLRADHKHVSELFLEYRRTRGREDRRALIDRICQELGVHAQIEEEIFYPAVKDAIDEPGIIAEARIEHATLKALMARLQGGQPGEESFEATVKVLAEYVVHHVGEEQAEIFPRARSSHLDLMELGARMLERKAELMSGDGQGSRMEDQTQASGQLS